MTALYKIVNRELSFVKSLDMPFPNCPDTWLWANGYDSSYTLRRGKVVDVTPAEIKALHRAHDRLKSQGKLPSAFDRIAGRIAR